MPSIMGLPTKEESTARGTLTPAIPGLYMPLQNLRKNGPWESVSAPTVGSRLSSHRQQRRICTTCKQAEELGPDRGKPAWSMPLPLSTTSTASRRNVRKKFQEASSSSSSSFSSSSCRHGPMLRQQGEASPGVLPRASPPPLPHKPPRSMS